MLKRILIRRLATIIALIISTLVGGYLAARPRPGGAAEPPVLPAAVTARPGRLTLIKANASNRVCWHLCRTNSAPDILPLTDGRELVFVAAHPGQYELIAWTAGPDGPTDAAHCMVKVESEEPPRPPDPFVAKLEAAWAQEGEPQKRLRVNLLASVYRIATDEIAPRNSVQTLGELHAAVHAAARAVLPDDALPLVRAAVADELRRSLPLDPELVLDASFRPKCVEVFRHIVEALNQLGD